MTTWRIVEGGCLSLGSLIEVGRMLEIGVGGTVIYLLIRKRTILKRMGRDSSILLRIVREGGIRSMERLQGRIDVIGGRCKHIIRSRMLLVL